MAVIEIPDEQAAALNAKAAALGLTLEAWLIKLAAENTASERSDLALQAAHHIREIAKRSKPDPEGLTVLDYIRQGRR